MGPLFDDDADTRRVEEAGRGESGHACAHHSNCLAGHRAKARFTSMDEMLRLQLPDGSERDVAPGTTGLEVAEGIGPRLAKAAVAVKLHGPLLDVERALPSRGAFEVVTRARPGGRAVFRHSAAPLLAPAVLSL